MSELRGLSFLGGRRAEPGERTFAAEDPATGERLPPAFFAASDADVDAACSRAYAASAVLRATPPAVRAAFLNDVASALEGDPHSVIGRARRETGLPEARLKSEMTRTCHQLRLFAGVVLQGAWVDARIDTADPGRRPAKPDVRSMRVSIGPVAVFGASNFPLAFSVAGGDTVSALAAGNPVVVKAHPAHPGTSELVGSILLACVSRAGLPDGAFSLLFDDGLSAGQALVQHPLVAAVGFTGSRAGGEALMQLAAARPVPIPVFAEMGSVNPVIVLPGALRERGPVIADGLHASFTLGVGQFCTNPGVVLVPEGTQGDAFLSRLAELTAGTAAGTMLSPRLRNAYESGLARLRDLGAKRAASGPEGGGSASGRAALWQTDLGRVLREPALLAEVFGPSTLVVRWGSDEELRSFVETLEGQLTATVHAEEGELAERAELLASLAARAGRLVFNQFPTGVEVNDAMVHGGPFPATSDGRSTSVGARAIERFSRLVSYQNAPDAVLPDELKDANPRGIPRLVDGARTSSPVTRT